MSSLYGFTMRKRWSQHWTKLLGNGGAGAEWLVFATPHSLYTRISGDDDLSCPCLVLSSSNDSEVVKIRL